MVCPTFQFIKGFWLLIPQKDPQIGGVVWFGFLATLRFVEASLPSCKLTPSHCSTMTVMWVWGESLSPGKLGKLGVINAFKELAGGIQTAATQVKVNRRILTETMHENSRVLNANLRTQT